MEHISYTMDTRALQMYKPKHSCLRYNYYMYTILYRVPQAQKSIAVFSTPLDVSFLGYTCSFLKTSNIVQLAGCTRW